MARKTAAPVIQEFLGYSAWMAPSFRQNLQQLSLPSLAARREIDRARLARLKLLQEKIEPAILLLLAIHIQMKQAATLQVAATLTGNVEEAMEFLVRCLLQLVFLETWHVMLLRLKNFQLQPQQRTRLRQGQSLHAASTVNETWLDVESTVALEEQSLNQQTVA